MNQYQNEVYESSSPAPSLTDDQCSLIDEGYWHDNDLILAAELGKALLDRNRKLELALEKSKSIEQEKDAEIEFLIKEITNLRELSQRKMEFVDEADRYNQELDNSNRQLMRKISEDQRKIQRLSNTIAMLEEQIAGLVERLKKYDNQSVMKGTEIFHSDFSSSTSSPTSTPLPTYRRHLLQKSSPISSSSTIRSSTKKINTTHRPITTCGTDNNDNNNNVDALSLRNMHKSTILSKNYSGYFKEKIKSKPMYNHNNNKRYTNKYSSVSLSGYREKGGLFFIDDELFDQPDIGVASGKSNSSILGSGNQQKLLRTNSKSSSILQLASEKTSYAQLSSYNLYHKMPWMLMINSKKRDGQKCTLLTDHDDDNVNGTLNTSSMLHRTFSWPRLNEMSFICDDHTDSSCNLANYDNSSQYTLNPDINDNLIDGKDNHDTSIFSMSNDYHCEEFCNGIHVNPLSESMTLSNSLLITESEVNRVGRSSTPSQVQHSDEQIPTSNHNNNKSNENENSLVSGFTKNTSIETKTDVTNDKLKPRISDQINDLLDDINFVSCLDRIYNPHIRSQYQDLINLDYKPAYRQLFYETFNMLKNVRKMGNRIK
ncbi:putative transcription factor [Schistosoma mansoni]|uniref:putative transcription factor n=1 Tax=Schistosoma mansoni TaxID=6183 RepID=UPI00022DBEA3|nr:putative transcription factor [Schistosoma mansoni]|eukprot:XP_018653137.1 putative transcription factor [Schistosoma mansoni]